MVTIQHLTSITAVEH